MYTHLRPTWCGSSSVKVLFVKYSNYEKGFPPSSGAADLVAEIKFEVSVGSTYNISTLVWNFTMMKRFTGNTKIHGHF